MFIALEADFRRLAFRDNETFLNAKVQIGYPRAGIGAAARYPVCPGAGLLKSLVAFELPSQMKSSLRPARPTPKSELNTLPPTSAFAVLYGAATG